MKKAIATEPNKPTLEVELTAEEITQREVDEATALIKAEEEAPIKARQDEYTAKGWLTPFDLIDDILELGINAVAAERADIKSRNPKK